MHLRFLLFLCILRTCFCSGAPGADASEVDAANEKSLAAFKLKHELKLEELRQTRNFPELIRYCETAWDQDKDDSQILGYLSWYLGYRASLVAEPEQGVQLIDKSISLLRDQGILQRPAETSFYRDLSWSYHHLLDMPLTPAGQRYRQRLASEMDHLFDGKDGRQLLLSISSKETVSNELEKKIQELQRRGFSIPLMTEMTQRYVSLDWRSPGAHCIYWLQAGLTLGKTEERVSSRALRRQIYFALQDQTEKGHVVRAENGVYYFTPDNAAYVAAIREQEEFIASMRQDRAVDTRGLEEGLAQFRGMAALNTYFAKGEEEASRLILQAKPQGFTCVVDYVRNAIQKEASPETLWTEFDKALRSHLEYTLIADLDNALACERKTRFMYEVLKQKPDTRENLLPLADLYRIQANCFLEDLSKDTPALMRNRVLNFLATIENTKAQ